MTLSARNARLVTLVAWTAFLGWLQLTAQVDRYLGPRTAWIVPVGAGALAIATLLYASSTAESPAARRPLRAPEGLGLAALLAPALVALCLADATLGSLAASNKLSSRGVDLARLASSLTRHSATVDFLVIRGADQDPQVAALRGITPGRPVNLTGLVLAPAAGPGKPLRLARFYITCCIADSVAIDVPVYLIGDAPHVKDEWLQVSGVLARRGGRFVVDAARARVVHAPAKPYLVFRV